MGQRKIERKKNSPVVCVILIVFAGGCKPTISSVSNDQSASLGFAQYVFYRCTTATKRGGAKSTYRISAMNNTTPEVSLQVDSENTPTLAFAELKKMGTDFWGDGSGFVLNLTNKGDGSKAILLTDIKNNFKISAENSFCNIVCSGPTKFVDGRCLWTGVTEESVIGNLIIETVATMGLGTVWRAVTLSRTIPATASGSVIADSKSTVLVLDSALRSGAQQIATAKSFDEAIDSLSKSLQKTNPLSGTSAVSGGNCANDAMTQLVSLVLGRWACAIPYPKGQLNYSTEKAIVDDLTRLVGVKEGHRAIANIGSFSRKTLAHKLSDGDVAFLFSSGPNAGHATLITKVKGQIVHINNQNWPQKFQSLEQWDELWRSSFGGSQPKYHVYMLSKKLIGF